MNNFKISLDSIKQYKELTGISKHIKAYSYNSINLDEYVYNTSKLVLDTRQLFVSSKYNSIDDISNYYGSNIYYFAGKYETQRICKCTIIPAEIESLRKNFKALIIVDDLDNTINIKLFPSTLYNYTLYDNPKDAGKEYIQKNLDKYYRIRNDALNGLNKNFEDIENDIRRKYEELCNKEILKEKEVFETNMDNYKVLLSTSKKMIEKYENLSKKIGL